MNSLNFNLWRENVSPLSQFEIKDILGLNALENFQISLTNIGFYLILGALAIFVINLLGISSRLVSNKWSIILELLYATIHSIVTNQINSKSGQIYFPFIFALFIFILINNLIGMVQLIRLYCIINSNFKLRGLGLLLCRRINIADHRLRGLIKSNRMVQSKTLVNWYSTTSSSNNQHSSSLVINPYYLTGFIDGMF